MIKIYRDVCKHPEAAAFCAVIFLADAANCVANGHDDWWFPAVGAALLALCVRPR